MLYVNLRKGQRGLGAGPLARAWLGHVRRRAGVCGCSLGVEHVQSLSVLPAMSRLRGCGYKASPLVQSSVEPGGGAGSQEGHLGKKERLTGGEGAPLRSQRSGVRGPTVPGDVGISDRQFLEHTVF